jgi:hypothetical protein
MSQCLRRAFSIAIALGVIALHCAWPVQAQTHDSATVRWQIFESAAGKFNVAFPGTPITTRATVRTEIGNVESVRHTAGDGADGTYDVTYNDYPKAGIARLSPAKLLDAARDGLVFQAKGRLVSEQPITVGKIAGREQEIVADDGMRYRIRLLLVENRLYQLTAMARPPARPDEQRFFGSFQLTGVIRP